MVVRLVDQQDILRRAL